MPTFKHAAEKIPDMYRKNTNLFLGVATGYSGNLDTMQAWVDRGVDWLALNSDYTYLQAGASKTVADIRQLQDS